MVIFYSELLLYQRVITMNDHLTWWFQPNPLKNDGVHHLGLYILFPFLFLESQSKFHGSSHHLQKGYTLW